MTWTGLILECLACACGGFVGTQIGHWLGYHQEAARRVSQRQGHAGGDKR